MGIFPFESEDSDGSRDSLMQRAGNAIREKRGLMVWTAGLMTFLLLPALALGTDFRNLEQSQTFIEDSQQNHTEPIEGSADTVEDVKPVDTVPGSSRSGNNTRGTDVWTDGHPGSSNSNKSTNNPANTRIPAEAGTSTPGNVKPSIPVEAGTGLNSRTPIN